MKISNITRLLPLGLLSMMLVVSAPAFSQKGDEENTVVVTGVVTDAALGTPMAGVKVTAYNNALHSAMTREDGSFQIKVPEYVTSLTFALEGCNTTVCALAGRTEGVDVKMYSDAFSEIYSTKTVASASVKANVSGLSDNLSIDNQIQQNMQGSLLATFRSGQLAVGASYLIDGISSLNINTQPLIVLDGILLDMGYNNTTMHDGYYSNLLANIQVEDIESVEVLKNGYGIYGAKGANGVIIINTKRNKSMATKIDLNISGNYQTMPKLPEMMNASQYRTYASELLGTTGTTLKNFKFLQSDPDYMYYNMYHQDTDWSEVAYREAFVQNYNVNVQGGDDIANYNLSVGYAFGDGILQESDFSRFSLRLNSDIILSDKLNLRFDASYSDITRDMRDDGAPDDIDNTMISAPGFLALAKSPFLSPYAFDYFGKVSNYLATEDDYLKEVLGNDVSLANPLSILENGDGLNKNYFGNRLITLAVTPEWKVNRYFSVYEHFTYTLANSDENYYIPLNGTPNFKIEGIGMVENKAAAMNAKQDGFMSNTYFKYAKRFQKHDLNVQGGVRYINNSLYQTSMMGYNSGNDKTPNMSSSLKYKKTTGTDTKDVSITWWAQGNYNLAEKYYLSASVGMQASSRFGDSVGSGVKIAVPWGIFPSVSAAWVASNEKWFNVDFINHLKLNVGFDMTGNDNYDNAASKTYFSPVKVLQMSGIAMANIGNNSLQWETTNKLTAGISMAMFDNRVNLSANVFKSKTDNLLSISALSFLTGLETSWTNGGSLENAGFDASLGVKLVNTNLVKWEAGAGIGHYKNEITALPIETVDYNAYGATIRSQVGNPVGVFYGYKTNGVFSTSEEAINSKLHMVDAAGISTPFEAGDMIFTDKNGDTVINEKDMDIIGDPNPDFYGRLYTNLNIKHFTLSASFAYQLGGDIYNYQRMLLESGSRFMNQTVAMTNHWTAEGQQTSVPRAVFGDPNGNARFSDRWIEDGSYLKLKNVTLSYNIPIASTYLQGLTIWGAANNLFTITDYLGSDPEFSTSNNILMRGIDRGLAPQTANFSLGLKINL
ncbi:MAG: SusC/RagA family TonB-linked outer membrane protein [Bacteroidaceae bacterium]|nr:SusC/RagA family TonB-linked outer membrane protein [Bacteroidaceae bacterium]